MADLNEFGSQYQTQLQFQDLILKNYKQMKSDIASLTDEYGNLNNSQKELLANLIKQKKLGDDNKANAEALAKILLKQKENLAEIGTFEEKLNVAQEKQGIKVKEISDLRMKFINEVTELQDKLDNEQDEKEKKRLANEIKQKKKNAQDLASAEKFQNEVLKQMRQKDIVDVKKAEEEAQKSLREQRLKDLKEQSDLTKEQRKELHELQAEEQRENNKGAGKRVVAAAINWASDQLMNVVDNAVNLVNQLGPKISYRLEGIGKNWNSIYGDVRNTVGLSGLVSQQQVLQKIGQAVDQGIAYNVEQRAFLSTISENIQSTFDAFDSNLQQIIRIQQADSTVARLGMEKALNDLLTNTYKDSSYLNQMYDTVASAVYEMSASSGRENAVEIEYVIQKWLGSLYSLGASSNAVQQIATGLGYLGSGNVQALSSNTSLQTLLAMSASRAGLDYANLLTSGLTSRDTNELLKAMVEYLAEIADQTSENKVVRSAYGNVFGLSMSDILSFRNLSPSIGQIYGDTLTYSQTQSVTQNAMNNYMSRLPLAAQMKTFFDNALFNAGMTYANDPVFYTMYKAVDLVDKMSGGGQNIDLQWWGLGTDFQIPKLIKSGMFGLGLIGSLLTGLGGAGNGAMNLSRWGYEDINTRGTGFTLNTTQGTSLSAAVGSASSADVQAQSLKEGTQTAEQVESASGKGDKKDVDDLYEALVRPSEKYQLSEVRLNTNELNQQFKKAMEVAGTLLDINSRNSINVNLSKINGQQVSDSNGLPMTADLSLKAFLLAVASFIKNGTMSNLFKGLGVTIQDQKEEEDYTLQDFLDAFVPMLQNENGVPVRIESIDSMSNLMQDLMKR